MWLSDIYIDLMVYAYFNFLFRFKNKKLHEKHLRRLVSIDKPTLIINYPLVLF